MAHEKIHGLTRDQIDRMPEYSAKWEKIGLCTEPADRPNAERAIAMMYEAAQWEPPKQIIWCKSPLEMAGMIQDMRSNSMALIPNYPDSPGYNIYSFIRDKEFVRSLGDILEKLDYPVDLEERQPWLESIMNKVCRPIGSRVYEVYLAAHIRFFHLFERPETYAHEYKIYGQHESAWLSRYSYLREVLGFQKETENLSGLMLLARSAGWAVPYENLCLVSERHNILNFDEKGNIHSLDGPAISYPDGWSIYAVHGTRVPGKWITERERLTWEDVYLNTDLGSLERRAGYKILGIDTEGAP